MIHQNGDGKFPHGLFPAVSGEQNAAIQKRGDGQRALPGCAASLVDLF
jgi:hypothetical protein